MAIKKPQLKSKLTEHEDHESVVKKGLKKKAPPIEEPDDEGDGDGEPEPPKKGLKKKSRDEGSSFAALFDKTKPGRQTFKAGKWRAFIVLLELNGEIDDGEQESDLSVKVTYKGDGNDDDKVDGKSITQTYTLFKDGEANEMGIGILKGDVDVLGYEDITLEDLEELCDSITSEAPAVIIQVKQNGTYTNAYLQGLAED